MNREELVNEILNVIEDNKSLHGQLTEYGYKITDIAEQYAENSIKNRFIQMMKEEPRKMAQWALLIMGIESRKCNADELTISEEADIEGSRYLIKAIITTEKV